MFRHGIKIRPDGPITVTVKVNTPDEAKKLIHDLEGDREMMGVGLLVVLTCLMAITLRYVFKR